MASSRDTRHTEFGGGPGSFQRHKDGSDVQLSVADRARIARMAAMRDLPSVTTPRMSNVTELTEDGPVVSAVPYGADAARIAELREKTNGYSDGAEGMSEQV